jgi:hypothetical protein
MATEQTTLGINKYGNNQRYLDNEEVCGNCLVPYTNSGKAHPIGDGTDCPVCREKDIAESFANQ